MNNGRHRAQRGFQDDHLAEVAKDDAFLTALSVNQPPTSNQPVDERLADLFAELKADIDAPMPQPPRIGCELASSDDSDARFPSRPKKGHPILSGLIGAAAATLLIAGSGVVVYNADEGSPFYGVSKTVFGDRQAVVELASTLDEMTDRAGDGDIQGIHRLIDEARDLVSSLERKGQDDEAATPQRSTTTVRAPKETVPGPAPTNPQPVENTVTVTVTETTTLEIQKDTSAPLSDEPVDDDAAAVDNSAGEGAYNDDANDVVPRAGVIEYPDASKTRAPQTPTSEPQTAKEYWDRYTE